MRTERLDIILVERGLAQSRTLAQRLVMAGQVRVNGQMIIKPSARMSEAAIVEVIQGPKYVSRGGEKLEAALIAFGKENLKGYTCADVGSSTGGFTDCMLQAGAARVYAIDVGHGILDWRLRQDARVVVMEETNARNVASLPEEMDLVTIDASFISLGVLLPVVRGWLKETQGEVIALIKPQFEAGRKVVAKGAGVVRNHEVHRQVLMDVLQYCKAAGWGVAGLIRSPLTGPKGNIEFLVSLKIVSVENHLPSLIEAAMDGLQSAAD
jgi:23S rRNA (cytidine1920-2'-O)/16S rRNA (cytidine1409-2'-O)-methyltransferase